MDSRRGNSAQRWRSPGHRQVRNSRASRSYSLYFHPRLCRPRGYRRTTSEACRVRCVRCLEQHLVMRFDMSASFTEPYCWQVQREDSSPPLLSPLPYFSPLWSLFTWHLSLYDCSCNYLDRSRSNIQLVLYVVYDFPSSSTRSLTSLPKR